MAATVGAEFNSTFFADVWQAVGSEVIIFVVTLVFALGIRSLSNTKGAAASGKAGLKEVPVTPKVVSGATPKSVRSSGPPQHREECQTPSPSFAARSARTSPAHQASPRQLPVARRGSPADLLNEIVEGTKEQTSLKFAAKALQVYQDELLVSLKHGGLSIKDVARSSRHSPLELYSTLVNCAIRVGKHHLVEALLDDMVEQGVNRPLAFYESAMRQLASQKQYHLALTMYDMLDKDGLRPSAVTCSCLIGFSAEVGELQRAVSFFESLSAMTTPSIRAYMTVLRVHAKRQDFEASIAIFRDMEKRGVAIDSLVLNVVLATCVAADQLPAVEQLVSEADVKSPPITDVVSFNTLLKACAQRGDAVRAKSVLARMKARRLRPNAITFNTAMDAMVRGGRAEDAWGLVADMRAAGLNPDKFTCSILVKGLAKDPAARQVKAALTLLGETEGACDASLKSTLYHSILESAAQVKVAGDASLAAAAFAQMRRFGVAPSPGAQRLVVQSLPGADLKDERRPGGHRFAASRMSFGRAMWGETCG
eukprot:CAMPEP_0177233160 /NCGR_PEP_ID=MMETSP0367-20130122/43718_1 /TAXON_ID=447022 ORGANISM="Scrippsiella hangoei-like, Strain SHHI-4" /NCGR_SAMPLE_ID=MMETSP0367 /ASSEMBLY_ACC=CAM_ASM_000362 /LENGTH=537 /DNA_ID=CAMNT_0018683875 /DNA_START=145 /DNA_END=1755 /DNA_ORIENTATION=-